MNVSKTVLTFNELDLIRYDPKVGVQNRTTQFDPDQVLKSRTLGKQRF
jgi:hypothetical protein